MKQFIACFVLAFCVIFVCGVSLKAGNSFRGVVVLIDDCTIMVKSGDIEKTFIVGNDGDVVWGKALSSKKRKALIEICQTVTVSFAAEGGSLKAKKIEIEKESDCYQ